MKAVDYGAVGVAVSTFFGWMPSIAAFLSVVWLVPRILTQIEEYRIKRRERIEAEKE
jgi:hypothetical protein